MDTGYSFDFANKRFTIKPLLVSSKQIFLSTVLAGTLARTLIAPFDVVQTLAQVGSKEGRKNYTTIVKDLWNKNGITAFFMGNLTECLRFIVTGGSYTTAFMGVRYLLGESTPLNDTIAITVSSMLASVIAYPLDTIRTRLVLDIEHKNYSGIIDCVNVTVTEEGIIALFKGVIPYVLGNFLVDELYERIWRSPTGWSLNEFLYKCLLALVGQAIYYPIDTVLKMVQAPNVHKALRPDVVFNNSLEAAGETITKHGFISLWRGFPVAAIKVVPAIVAAITSLEILKRVFNAINVYYQLQSN